MNRRRPSLAVGTDWNTPSLFDHQVAIITYIINAIIGAVTVTGSGFLDLSNIVRYFLIGFAVVFGITAVISGRYGWMSR